MMAVSAVSCPSILMTSISLIFIVNLSFDNGHCKSTSTLTYFIVMATPGEKWRGSTSGGGVGGREKYRQGGGTAGRGWRGGNTGNRGDRSNRSTIGGRGGEMPPGRP